MEAGLKQFSTGMFNWSLTLMVQIITNEPGGLATLLTRPQLKIKAKIRQGKTKTKT